MRPWPRKRALRLLRTLALVLLALAGGARAFAQSSPHTSPTPRTTLSAVESQVMCVTCKIPLTVAVSPQANRERAYIQRLIDRGETLAQIKRALVFQYTDAVLALPPSHGFDLGVYLVPGAVVLVLLATVAVLLPRWRRRARAAQAAREAEGVASTPLDGADAARLEADMARFD
jgi:cytochrome c-type biogenesis protein CcmH/NrfF